MGRTNLLLVGCLVYLPSVAAAVCASAAATVVAAAAVAAAARIGCLLFVDSAA